MTEGTPSPDREYLERIRIRPTRRRKTLAEVADNGFVAEQFYTPYTLRHENGERKFYLFSGAVRNIGDRFVAMHADGWEHEGWRGDWMVVDPDLVPDNVQEWAIIS
jgi:hypothetical protein